MNATRIHTHTRTPERVFLVLTGRWSLSLSPEDFHFTPHYPRLSPSACCPSLTELQPPGSLSSPPPASASLTSPLSSPRSCLLCQLRVECQVQSQLTDGSWHVCVGAKPAKGSVPLRSPSATLPVFLLPFVLVNPPSPWEASLRGAFRVISGQLKILGSCYRHQKQKAYGSLSCDAFKFCWSQTLKGLCFLSVAK